MLSWAEAQFKGQAIQSQGSAAVLCEEKLGKQSRDMMDIVFK